MRRVITFPACLTGSGPLYPNNFPMQQVQSASTCEETGLATPGDQPQHRPDTVALMIADEQGGLLVFWHARYQFWTVPLGKIEEGESDVGAACREAFEELGIASIKVDVVDIIHKPANLDDYSDIIIALCWVVSYSGTVTNREPDKHYELRFVSPDQICALFPISYPTQVIAKKLKKCDLPKNLCGAVSARRTT